MTVIASSLSYLSGKKRPGEGHAEETENDPGGGRLTVRRAYVPSLLHQSFLARLANFLVFMVSSGILGLKLGRDVTLILGTTPPLFQALSACGVAALLRKPFVLEVRDLWPDSAIEMGLLRNKVLIAISRLAERFLYVRARAIIINSPGFRAHLKSCGVPDERISLVPNGVDASMFRLDEARDEVRRSRQWEEKFVVTYAGAIGPANALEVLVEAAALLVDRPEIRFVLVGDGKARTALEEGVASRCLSNVEFLGLRPKDEVARLLAGADACVATLQPIPIFRTTYPNKVFDYMASGKPIVLSIDGVIREVVEEAGAGIFVPPGDARALADAVVKLAQDLESSKEMGLRGRRFVESRFSRESQATAFLRTLDSCAGGS